MAKEELDRIEDEIEELEAKAETKEDKTDAREKAAQVRGMELDIKDAVRENRLKEPIDEEIDRIKESLDDTKEDINA